jgi:hypothetical protein
MHCRFWDATKLRGISWLKIKGKIHSMMLSKNLTYHVHMVFKLAADGFKNLDFPFQVASVSFRGSESTRRVCLQGYIEVGDDGLPQKHVLNAASKNFVQFILRNDALVLPRKRADGWMEVEMGEFFNEEGYDGEVSFILMDSRGGPMKDGLVVWGIEIRAKSMSF